MTSPLIDQAPIGTSSVEELRPYAEKVANEKLGKDPITLGDLKGHAPLEYTPSSFISSRVSELESQIPQNSRGRITMGIALVEDEAENQKTLISIFKPNGYLRPGVS